MGVMGVMSRVAAAFRMTEEAWKRHANLPAAAGFVLLAYGLVALDVWPTVFGATLIVLGQLWRIDRLVVFYDGTQ